MRRSPRTGLPIIPKTPPRRSGRCAERPPAALQEGIALFNAGDFWQCHEVLERLWREEPDSIRSLYQGILLVGVGYWHWQRHNPPGARAKLRQGLACLAPFQPACMGIDVEGLTVAARRALAAIEAASGQASPDGPTVTPPQIRWGARA